MVAWRMVLRARSPALLGGIGHAPAGVHAATARLSDDRLLLPGTSLRGVLRDAFRRFAQARTGSPCSGGPPCTCACCRLFGTSQRAGALAVRSASARGRQVIVAGVAIDRDLRTAHRSGRALWSELRGIADFETRIVAWASLEPEDLRLVEDFWGWLAQVGLSLGRRKSAGAGRFQVTVTRMEADHTRPALSPSVAEETPSRFRLAIRLVEPARVVGPRQRDFYREGLDAIPVATLRGAIGWAFARAGLESVARDLFIETPVSLTPAFPASDRSAAVPWLSARRCRANPAHRWDAALRRTARAMGMTDVRPDACPVCGLDGEADDNGDGELQLLVIGRTAIDPARGGAAHGQLHYEVALAPGQEFVAELVARPSQADAIAQLGEIIVGGRRARGMGLAEVRITRVSDPVPVTARLQATATGLGALGVAEPDGVAVLGMLTDAAVPNGLRRALADLDLEVLTGEVRTVERGGWDEQTGEPRSLRRLLRAGSWVSVRVKSERGLRNLQELEARGLPDAENVAPLMIRVRDDFSPAATE